jgi:hypothetical protein
MKKKDFELLANWLRKLPETQQVCENQQHKLVGSLAVVLLMNYPDFQYGTFVSAAKFQK